MSDERRGDADVWGKPPEEIAALEFFFREFMFEFADERVELRAAGAAMGSADETFWGREVSCEFFALGRVWTGAAELPSLFWSSSLVERCRFISNGVNWNIPTAENFSKQVHKSISQKDAFRRRNEQKVHANEKKSFLFFFSMNRSSQREGKVERVSNNRIIDFHSNDKCAR